MEPQSRPDTAADARRLRIAFGIAVALVMLLWMVKIIEVAGGLDFTRFGIYPQSLGGLAGIIFAPFIHASFAHLFANTAPFIVIGTMLSYGYPRAFKLLLPSLYLGGGAAVWMFAREAYHIGASGIVFGMLFFVLTIGILRWDRRAIALSMVVFLLYGGMVWGVLPTLEEISFESHLSGGLIGLVLAFLLKNRDPEPPRKRYSWELEEAETDGFDWPDRL